MKKPETIEEILGQLAGAASTCWIPNTGAAEFDSVQASKFVDEALAQIRELTTTPSRSQEVLALVSEQAEDPGLWSFPIGRQQTIHEAHLQQELRKLHAAIEKLLGGTQKDAK